MNLRTLCMAFLDQDDDAKAWGSTPEEFTDAPDCDVMAKRFAHFAETNGHPAEVVQVNVHAEFEGCTDIHLFTVIDGVAVDWTARQFHNVEGVNLDASEIPSPLLFLWPGPYPLPTITVQED